MTKRYSSRFTAAATSNSARLDRAVSSVEQSLDQPLAWDVAMTVVDLGAAYVQCTEINEWHGCLARDIAASNSSPRPIDRSKKLAQACRKITRSDPSGRVCRELDVSDIPLTCKVSGVEFTARALGAGFVACSAHIG